MRQPFQLKPLVIALSVLGTTLPLYVFAEETPQQAGDSESDVITLSDVVVTGATKKATVVPKRKVTSIYGTDSSVLDTPRVVSQVSEQQFREDVIRSADDLVKYAPSITRGGGQNANFAPQIRGQNSEVFQDSQRIYSTRHPTNLNAYEGADIVAGPTGVIFAPTSGSGGYINYLTKKPNFNKAETNISGTVGSIYSGKGAEPNFSVSIDHTAPISKELAFRVSATAQKTDDYYDNVKNNFNAFYGALAWRPNDRLRVDWNISYDDYYDFNVTHGWNRASQQSVDNGLYYKGRATPIIQNGSTFWSPVFESGAANSKVIGWQTRQKNDKNQYVAVGGVQTTPLPNSTADQAGTIKGWVYDPSIPGNELVKLDDNVSGRSEDKNSAKRFGTQLKVIKDLNDHWSIANSTLYQNNKDLGDSVGSFFTDLDHELIDNRLEFLGDYDFEIAGVKINNKSSTGGTYRHEKFTSLAANNSFNINPYDLTNDPSQKNPGDLLGLINNSGSTGGWIGQAGVPQYSQYFGYLNLPRMYPIGNGLYAEKGG
ncbi:TonB-dependent receptor plug domain-containing protein, partial [Acinetobacter sp. AKBS16]|uniref:TonB-dependent receptor plug domain-containing protein n=1 Tax=Acinetobacter sp. AKBS16 TaxID=2072504 RepID=UPI003A100A89